MVGKPNSPGRICLPTTSSSAGAAGAGAGAAGFGASGSTNPESAATGFTKSL